MSGRIATVLIWLLPVILFAALFWNYLTPSGHKIVRLDVGDRSPYIQRLLPDERVSEVKTSDGDNYVTLLDEPAYFSVTPPLGSFERVKVKIAFDPGGTPTLELGALKDVAAQAFDFRPLANDLLEDLGDLWSRNELGNGLALFSRDPDDDAFVTFLDAPPDRSRVAMYKTEFPEPYRLGDYRPLGRSQHFDVDLRGPHELLTYVKDEIFEFSASCTDVNRTFGRDDGFIKVFNENGDLMTQETLRDDGNLQDNQRPSDKLSLSLVGPGWAEGVYRIVLSGTSDIVWRSLSTPQRYLVVKNRIFIGDVVGQLPEPVPTTLYTNAKRLTYETQHVEGLQTIRAGDEDLTIGTVGGKFAQNLSTPGVIAITSPVGDVKITGEGKYAFSRESWFDPDPLPVTAFTNLEDSEVDYVLANLAPIETEGSWRVASAEFDLSELATENRAYKFALSAPGIHADVGEVSIHAFEVTFSKPPVSTSGFWQELKHLVKLLLP